jgi:dynein heavy chain
MQKEFNHKDDEFTLEKIIEYGFDQYADTINEVSGAATKELAIEQVCYSNTSLCCTVKPV